MTRSRLALVLTALVVVAAALAAARHSARAERSSGAPHGAPGEAVITSVVDGDTVRARLNGGVERVRLIGIDTPESRKPGTPVECFAKEASARTADLLPAGTRVRLVRDIEARDRYGRLLAYVYRLDDGLFVNLTLARDGFAAPLTIPPNVAHAEEFAAAAGQARRASRGLWARCRSAHDSGGGHPPGAASGVPP